MKTTENGSYCSYSEPDLCIEPSLPANANMAAVLFLLPRIDSTISGVGGAVLAYSFVQPATHPEDLDTSNGVIHIGE